MKRIRSPFDATLGAINSLPRVISIFLKTAFFGSIIVWSLWIFTELFSETSSNLILLVVAPVFLMFLLLNAEIVVRILNSLRSSSADGNTNV